LLAIPSTFNSSVRKLREREYLKYPVEACKKDFDLLRDLKVLLDCVKLKNDVMEGPLNRFKKDRPTEEEETIKFDFLN
jgi:hypothetical protein